MNPGGAREMHLARLRRMGVRHQRARPRRRSSTGPAPSRCSTWARAISGISRAARRTRSRRSARTPCHALLAFNDGLYSEHGTFGVSDGMSRFDTAEPWRRHTAFTNEASVATMREGTAYIMQGPIIRADGAQARPPSVRSTAAPFTWLHAVGAEAARELGRRHASCRVGAGVSDRNDDDGDGAAQAEERAQCSSRVEHWHAERQRGEWHYVTEGTDVKMTLVQAPTSLWRPQRAIVQGDSAYVRHGYGHTVKNIGDGEYRARRRA